MEDLVRVTEQWDGDEGEQGFPPLLSGFALSLNSYLLLARLTRRWTGYLTR